MFNLIFDGVFELKYPNEFIEDLNQLKEKHDAHFMGKIRMQDLGEYVDYQYLPCLVTEFSEILSDDQLEYSTMLEVVDWEQISENFNSIIATLGFQSEAFLEGTKPYIFPVLDPVKYEYKKKLLREHEDLSILQDINGNYFVYNRISAKRTKGVSSIYEISDQMLKSVSNQY